MDFVHWVTAGGTGAAGTLGGVEVALSGLMGTAFYFHDDYPNFSGPAFTPPQAATGMVEIVGGPGHTFTLTFGAPVADPVVFLGSFGSVLALPAGTAVTRVSGDAGFAVVGSTVTGEPANPVVLADGSLSLSDSNGTVLVSGLFSSLTFTLTPNYAGSAPDGVFLQVGGMALATSDDLIAGVGALQSSARRAWADVVSIAREFAERAIADAAAGHTAASMVSQRASTEVLTGAWSTPAPPADGDPAVAAAVAHAQQAWAAAVAARDRGAAAVAGARAALELLVGSGASVPPGLGDFRDPLQGPVAFCDFDGGLQSLGGPLTFGAATGEWTRGDLRVSVDMNGASLTPDPPQHPGDPAPTADELLSQGEQKIRAAIDDWRQTGAEVSAVPGKGFFTFHPVGKGQPAEIQVTFIEPASFDPPEPPDTDVEAAGKHPEIGILRFNKLMSPSLDHLTFVTHHEFGHVLGLGHNGIPGTLMSAIDPDDDRIGIDDPARQAYALMYGWLPRKNLTDRATNDRPNLHVVRRDADYIPQMLWRGPLDDETIFHSQFIANGWTTQSNAGVGKSSHTPGVTAVDGAQPGIDIGTRLLMAWKGPGQNPGLFWSRQTTPDGPFLLAGGKTSRRTDFGTSAGPSLATLGDQVTMVWKGAEPDTRIWFATLDAAASGEKWSPQNPVPGALTSHSPALVSWHSRLFLFWKEASSTKLFFTTRDPGADWAVVPTQVVYPGKITTDSAAAQPVLTDAAPAAAARPRDIMLVWKGAGERPVHVSLFDGLTFSGQAPISQSGTIGSPGVTALPDILGTPTTLTGPGPAFVAWKGDKDDRTLHWTKITSV
jgi:hypothetical protein